MNIAEFNVSEMSDFELQGVLHSWLAQVKNRLRLEKLAEVMKPVIDEDEDDAEDEIIFWNNYTPKQRTELEQAFEESLDPTGTDHEIMRKKHAKWLNI